MSDLTPYIDALTVDLRELALNPVAPSVILECVKSNLDDPTAAGRAAFQLGVDLAEGASTFLTAGAEAEWYDPTHGRVDRDIQEYVDRMDPKSIAQRVAIENTLQARRGNRLTPAGTTTVELLEDAAREAGWAAGALDVADIELERTVRPGLVAAYRWPTNAHLIADVAELYLDPGMRAVDVTYGLGKWWQIWRPLELVEHDLDPKKGDGVNFTALPEADNTYDLAALDPPYVAPGGRATSGAAVAGMVHAFGMQTSHRTPAGNQTMIEAGLAELYRVLRPTRRVRGRAVSGIALVKVMDYVTGGRLFPATYLTTKAALELGFRLEDRIEHLSTRGGPQPTTNPDGTPRRQMHARRNYSTLLILTKG